jgi:PII-like signaling protein
MDKSNGNGNQALAVPSSLLGEASGQRAGATVYPAWTAFIRLCQQIEFGELERVKLQDGLPVSVEVVKKRIKVA